jgi:chaperonin GroEL
MQTNAVAGDGTTTAIVLANALVQGGAEALDLGAKAIDLCHGIDLAVSSVLASLKATARPATDEATLTSVATVARPTRRSALLSPRLSQKSATRASSRQNSA